MEVEEMRCMRICVCVRMGREHLMRWNYARVNLAVNLRDRQGSFKLSNSSDVSGLLGDRGLERKTHDALLGVERYALLDFCRALFFPFSRGYISWILR